MNDELCDLYVKHVVFGDKPIKNYYLTLQFTSNSSLFWFTTLSSALFIGTAGNCSDTCLTNRKVSN